MCNGMLDYFQSCFENLPGAFDAMFAKMDEGITPDELLVASLIYRDVRMDGGPWYVDVGAASAIHILEREIVGEAPPCLPVTTCTMDIVLKLYGRALAEIAHVSFVGNQQHNPGQPLHHARHKSTDWENAALRHFCDFQWTDTDGLLHMAKVGWRMMEGSQKWHEGLGAPLARAAVVIPPPPNYNPDDVAFRKAATDIGRSATVTVDLKYPDGVMYIVSNDYLTDFGPNLRYSAPTTETSERDDFSRDDDATGV